MITYEDCEGIEISFPKPFGNAIINLDIDPAELAWILNECVKSGVVSSAKRGIKMTGTELRWCTIDGTTWVASDGKRQLTIELVEVMENTFAYQAHCPPSDVNSTGFLGSYDTINEAKAACLEYLK